MTLSFSNIGKKFYQRWIFRRISGKLSVSEKLVLIGRNGSGKSTLMRIFAGQLSQSEGELEYRIGNKKLPVGNLYQYISWSAPYLDMYLDLSLAEHLNLHFRFKECLLNHPQEIIDVLKLNEHEHKKLRYYSSGMLQRAKVGMALFTKSPLLLLDEPTSNMDTQNAALMLDLIHTYSQNRLLILASNMEREYDGIENIITL